MKNLLCKKAFTLVEVLIAMGVCVIGVCSIMVLFPVGATASRDAAMASYASNTAEQILSFAKMCIEEDTLNTNDTTDSGYKAFNYFTGWNITTPNGYTPGAPIETAPNDFEDEEFDLRTKFNYSGKIGSVISTFLSNSGTSIKPLYNGKVYYVDFTSGTGSDKYSDFNCYASIYAKPVVVTSGAHTYNMPFAAELHVEVSWPAELAYDKRHKKDYSIMVYKAY